MAIHNFRKRLASATVVIVASLLSGFAAADENPIIQAAQAAEQALQARVGLAVHDTGTGQWWLHGAEDRFPLASTAKVLICGTLLAQGPTVLDTTVRVQQSDILAYAPTTKGLVGQDVPAAELCAITLRNSDNTAANGVLQIIGGPSAVTSFVRTLGDPFTRLDRNEPTLNEGRPGDPRDTTTPLAMAETTQALVLGNALEEPARQQLTAWMAANEVADSVLRAGVPSDWRVADRTGSAGFGTRGMVAVMWPPHRAPIVVAIYLTETEASLQERDAAIAAIGKAIATTLK